jgi:hypothetical protein
MNVFVLKNLDQIVIISPNYDEVLSVLLDEVNYDVNSAILSEIINSGKYKDYTIEEFVLIDKKQLHNNIETKLPPIDFNYIHPKDKNNEFIHPLFFIN